MNTKIIIGLASVVLLTSSLFAGGNYGDRGNHRYEKSYKHSKKEHVRNKHSKKEHVRNNHRREIRREIRHEERYLARQEARREMRRQKRQRVRKEIRQQERRKARREVRREMYSDSYYGHRVYRPHPLDFLRHPPRVSFRFH